MPPATVGSSAAGAASTASAAKTRAYLAQLLSPLVADAGYDLEDVTVSAAGRRSLVRVVVDRDGGIDLDAVAEISRVVADALDSDATADAQLKGSYVLEVSSPGVDRPLTEPRHWRRATGRLVRTGEITGRVMSVDDEGVLLEADGQRTVHAWDALAPGRVQVEFNRSGESTEEG